MVSALDPMSSLSLCGIGALVPYIDVVLTLSVADNNNCGAHQNICMRTECACSAKVVIKVDTFSEQFDNNE